MKIINSAAARNLFDLNISTRELKKLQKLSNVGLSNLTLRRLHKTIATSDNEIKKNAIKQLLNKLTYSNYNPSVTGDHNQERKILEQQSANIALQNKKAKEEEQQVVLRQPDFRPVGANQKAIAVKKLNMLGVNITALPKSYGELLSAIKRDLPADVSTALEKRFKKFSDERSLNPKNTQRILRQLIKSPVCLQNFTEQFGGKHSTAWSQTETILSNVQIGQDGLCGSLSFKWCGDKFHRISFFSDTASPEGLNEVLTLKLSNPRLIEEYLLDRGLRPRLSVPDGIDVQNSIFSLMMLDPKEGTGHAIAAQCYKQSNEYRFFDPNSGEFSFSNPENMEQFIITYVNILYPDFLNIKTFHFNRID
ncbi:hypothetical protein J2X14_003692 [Pantoea alhagi]|uniref:YopT-type cysteine protease domain-containing protein n=1 Tax=Mixta sp. BE291 TaxID=3158787 RepID=UPI002858728A|nr:hypothetical protein [Pantoea alhagi]